MTKNKTVKQIMLAGMTLIILMGLVLVWFWKSLPPQLPWFYSLPGGEQQLVNKIILAAMLPGLAVTMLMTRIFARWAGKGDGPVETTLMTGILTVIVLFAAGFFRVMQIFAL